MNLSVVFVDSRFIRKLNRRYLRHDAVTDVIAFPLGRDEGMHGEVYVNLDRARSQARRYGVAFGEEVRRLVVHGVLHLLGYSDEGPKRQERMRRREDAILAYLSQTRRNYDARADC